MEADRAMLLLTLVAARFCIEMVVARDTGNDLSVLRETEALLV